MWRSPQTGLGVYPMAMGERRAAGVSGSGVPGRGRRGEGAGVGREGGKKGCRGGVSGRERREERRMGAPGQERSGQEVLFEKAPAGKAMHGFTRNYVRVELTRLGYVKLA